MARSRLKHKEGDVEPQDRRKIKRDILKRVRLLYSFFFLMGGIIILRIGWIQLFSQDVAINAEKIQGRIFHNQSIRAHRGSILARDGEALATSIIRYQVEMDFGSEGFDSPDEYMRQSDSLSKLLAAYFRDRSVAEYRQLFRRQRDKHYQLKYRKDTLVMRSDGWMERLVDMMRGESMVSQKLYDTIRDHRTVTIFPREVDYSEWQTLRRYPILNWNMGMTYRLEDRDERVYTKSGVAQRTIGAINADRGDDYGIEAIYNEQLSGKDGEVLRQRIARGFYGRVVGGVSRDAVDGLDVVTTIDADLQDIVHTALLEQVTTQRAIWGTAVVMEVATGDILAISNLDRLSNGRYAEQRNRAIGARAEPGSTFKLLSTMALLEEAKMPTSQVYDSENGERVKVGNAWVRDSHREGFEVDLHTAFVKSLNVYFAKAIYENYKDEPRRYTDFLKVVGLGSTMGLEAYGEQLPRLPEQGSQLWTPHMTLVNMAYGYGVELAPIQTLTLYNALANNGRMMAPRLVKEIQRDGREVEEFAPKVLNEKICSQPTIDTLRNLLGCVSESGGTAHWYLGNFNGFEVAAKTGTAQFAQDGYHHKDGIYIGSMVGYIPADKPKYSVIVALRIKQGQSTTIYGAGLAGPVMRDVMQQIYNRESGWQARLDTMPQRSRPSNIKGGDIASIRRVANDLNPRTIDSGEVQGWGKVAYDSLSRLTIKEIDLKDGVMPNLYGLGLRDAIYLMESRGVSVKFKGTGSVWRQSVRAGSRISRGGEVTLQLR
ncbi:MAG: penicillin-binding protein [Rikenellaceae bacterium]